MHKHALLMWLALLSTCTPTCNQKLEKGGYTTCTYVVSGQNTSLSIAIEFYYEQYKRVYHTLGFLYTTTINYYRIQLNMYPPKFQIYKTFCMQLTKAYEAGRSCYQVAGNSAMSALKISLPLSTT